MKNFYEILGIKETATFDEIRIAYRKLATKFHPDKNFGDKYFEERFKEIQTAYDTLSNQNLRNNYNKKLNDFKNKAEPFQWKTEHDEQSENNFNKSQSNYPEDGRNVKNSLFTLLKEIIFSKFFAIFILVLIVFITSFKLNRTDGLLTVGLLLMCIIIFLSTIKDSNYNKSFMTLLYGLIGAPILSLYLLYQIFIFFFPFSPNSELTPIRIRQK